MTVQNGKYSARADHRRHDRLLVTRYAMDDSYPGERAEADQLVATCADCAELAADVRVIAASMKQIAAPRRPRDFTISQEQADRLRGSRLSQLLRGLATPGWATLRPVAGVALSIGLVMAVVGSVIPDQTPAAGGDGGSLQMIQTEGTPETPAPARPRPAAGATPEGEKAPDMAASPDAVEAPDAAASPAVAEAPDMASSPAPADAPAAAASPGAAGAPGASRVPVLAAPGSAAGEGSEDFLPEPAGTPTQDVVTRNLDTIYTEEPSPDAALYAGDGDDAGALLQSVSGDPTRNVLIYAGLAIAAISLAVLVLAWGTRRYFADPLLR